MAKGLSDPYAGHAKPHPIPWPCMQLSNRAVSHPNGSIRYLREAVFAKPIRIGLPYFKETVGVIVKDTLLAEEIASYWNGRAESYSNGVNGELSDGRKDAWSTELQHILAGQIELAKAENRPARILDLGCGPGFFSIILSRMGLTVDAVDGSIEMLARAQENANARKQMIPSRFASQMWLRSRSMIARSMPLFLEISRGSCATLRAHIVSGCAC